MVERLRSELDIHRRDPFAHPALIGRLTEENKDIREDFETRLRNVETRQWWLLGVGALLAFEIPLVVYLLPVWIPVK